MRFIRTTDSPWHCVAVCSCHSKLRYKLPKRALWLIYCWATWFKGRILVNNVWVNGLILLKCSIRSFPLRFCSLLPRYVCSYLCALFLSYPLLVIVYVIFFAFYSVLSPAIFFPASAHFYNCGYIFYVHNICLLSHHCTRNSSTGNSNVIERWCLILSRFWVLADFLPATYWPNQDCTLTWACLGFSWL